jgi:hypothetical protein
MVGIAVGGDAALIGGARGCRASLFEYAVDLFQSLAMLPVEASLKALETC